jgi:hypothetical protein
MSPMTTRTQAQAQASRMNGCKSNGPSSPDGAQRAALNSTRHGIRAQRVLLEGEGVENYLAEAERWVESLQPVTDAETEIVLDLVDLRVRLARVDKAEKKAILAAVTEMLKKEKESQRLSLETSAITALAAMKSVIDHSHPTDVDRLKGFLSAVRDVVDMVKQVEALGDSLVPGLLQLEAALKEVASDTIEEWPEVAYRSLGHFAGLVQADLQRRKEVDEVKVREIEMDLVEQAVPKNDAEGKRLETYRRQLERRFQAQLDVLGHLHRLRPPQASGSFVRPVLVNLRGAAASPALAQQ